MKPDQTKPPGGEFLLYTTEDGRTRIECRFDEQTIWLSQAQLAELFQVSVSSINEHLSGIYAEAELDPERTLRNFRIVRKEGSRQVTRNIEHHRLEAVIAVGYRVRSERGTQFRQWATAKLQEFLLKGFVMDDERLKNPPSPEVPNYFDELLARIRDIRSSEKVFWRKVLEIYATSIDYDPKLEASQRFFATVQNKMHWAAHGNTAAEIVQQRANANKPNMGLTSFSGATPRQQEVGIAKNYLNAEELDVLNRVVTAYLEFAELQALNRKAMHMADWVNKLDDFLRLSDRNILAHAGNVSHQAAVQHAMAEHKKFSLQQAALPSRVERDFEQALRTLPKAPVKPSHPPKKK